LFDSHLRADLSLVSCSGELFCTNWFRASFSDCRSRSKHFYIWSSVFSHSFRVWRFLGFLGFRTTTSSKKQATGGGGGGAMAINANGRTLCFLSTRLLKSSFASLSSSSVSVGELNFFLPYSVPLAVYSDTRVNSLWFASIGHLDVCNSLFFSF
jgi:hypothetical protein